MPTLNYLRQVIRHPCAPGGLNVMVETGLRALVPALAVFVTADCFTLLRTGIRNERIRSGRRPPDERGGHRGLAMGGGKKFAPTFSTDSNFAFEGIVGPVGQALWAWAIFEASTDFFINWTSMAYVESGCDLPSDGYHDWPLIVPGVINTGPVQTVLVDCTVVNPCANCNGFSINILPGCYGQVSYTAQWQEHPGCAHPGTGSITTWLEDDDGNRSSDSTWPPPPGFKSDGTAGGMRVNGGVSFGNTFRIQAQATGCAMDYISGSVSVSAYGRPVPLFPIDVCGAGLITSRG